MAIKRLEISDPQFGQDNTQVITLHSSHLDGRSDLSVYNFNARGKNLPIIILMHGVYGSHWVWMQLGGVHQVYEQLKQSGLGEFVLVMPSDGGFKDGSAYLPLVSRHQNKDYEQWIMQDVLTAVIESNECVSEESNLYLTGLSMGGYGALRLGAKYADKVKGISAHSAITRLADLSHFIDDPLDIYQCTDPQEASILHWLKKHQDSLPPMRFDCGSSDVLFESNQQLSDVLKELSITHRFETFPGEHSWSYWHKYIANTFWFFNEIQHKPLSGG